ncbi:urea carboxylase [Synoicihabitans lomoniglobus]|uniref:Urea carboxylase n=1 Tax=Synoicihabitans lomoniglobus TaxID=2909285 RepID=A0AAF0CN17_9BACT|nr:urea carboxylase [Opitutaceae bacterium LMO-M01]WED64908.1 urea carboxylase [Opitutaceae bacterium LMO-M01]
MPFTKVLIANRGAIACRVIRTLRTMGIKSVAVYSEADAGSLHVSQADEAVCIGPAPAAQSYLDADKILAVAKDTGAEAIHPGYGFLSENPDFAEACAAAGIIFIGPTAAHMRTFGLKHTARTLAAASNVPLLPGSELLGSLAEAQREAARIGSPVMLKSTAGGGGIGMSLIRSADALPAAFDSVARLAKNNFNEGGVFLEKFVERARHIEVQIFGDGLGHVVALGERDCSAQRRNQKVVEETPAPGITPEARAELLACAKRLGESAGYQNAGTVEFVYDDNSGEFYFLEVNTRLQVEHGVTEEVTGIDLVEWMIQQASGELGSLADYAPTSTGASIQVRLYSEDPGKSFQPATGILTELQFPADARIETWVERGADVSPYYDPMLAKIIVRGADRAEALQRMSAALAATEVHGLESNLAYLAQVIASPEFQSGRITTRSLESMAYAASTIDVLDGGTQTTVQDYPGRTGYWDVGVPPSGPMDHLSFRLANRLVGNPSDAAGLEITVAGPTLTFNTAAIIALTGAKLPATLDGEPVPSWQPIAVVPGQTLRLPAAPSASAGLRAYLAVRGGLDVPDYLGSKATFTLGLFGGHAGRALRVGDVLRVAAAPSTGEPTPLPAALRPSITRSWEIGVLYGPHGAPDFFKDEDIADLFSATYEVHYNSARTGVRLIGPKPRWARTDGGEAGLHPSNIHDNAYAVGAIDFTGDMPIILGPDGPSLGGFVCPAAIVQSELWKMGQLKPGDKVRFKALTASDARQAELAQDEMIEALQGRACSPSAPTVASTPESRTGALGEHALPAESAIIHQTPAHGDCPAVCYRRAGDRYLLIEYGPMVLDLDLRFRVHALYSALVERDLDGVLDLTPGIRSLQVHYDQLVLPLDKLMALLIAAEAALPDIDEMEVPTRIVHLPLSWEDESTLLAIRKYMQIVRKDAPWCPSNIEFIRRINGLDSVDEVKRIAFEASYLVLGLGDVYLGAPVATPIDPRHRLVTTKYNPARTWTPENAVGIGGAYLCVYGMEGPGGYQFIGRTIQMWNRWRQTTDFAEGKPWLLRFFDQIKFYEVSAEELVRFREDFPHGRYKLKVEHKTLRLHDYHQFLADNQPSIEAFKAKQQASFEAERQRWEESGQLNYSSETEAAIGATTDAAPLPEGHHAVVAHVPGNVWKIQVAVGDHVEADAVLVILESMKMEINSVAPIAGEITAIRCAEGSPVQAGDTLIVIKSD